MLASVWQPLIVCDPTNGAGADGAALPDCDYYALIHLIKNAIADLTVVATIATVAACIFIGFRLMTSQGNSGAMREAKDKATKIVIGYFFILAGWVIVYAVASVLLKGEYYNNVLTK